MEGISLASVDSSSEDKEKYLVIAGNSDFFLSTVNRALLPSSDADEAVLPVVHVRDAFVDVNIIQGKSLASQIVIRVDTSGIKREIYIKEARDSDSYGKS